MNNYWIWSDNWWIENDEAWFVEGDKNLLFHYSFHTSECDFLAEIPDESESTFRLNSRCIKFGEEIFCMPDNSSSIWVYHLKDKKFQEIKISNPANVRIGMTHFWKYKEKIIAVSHGLSMLFEIDIQEKKIDNYYPLEGVIASCIKVNDFIYYVAREKNSVFQFDLTKKSIIEYHLEEFSKGIHTICYDGKNFWLSGYCKEIYLWNKEDNSVKVLDCFPKSFGIYNYAMDGELLLDCDSEKYEAPAFLDSVALGQYIWFIPFKTNKIIYINQNTYEINSLDCSYEDETRTSLAQNMMKHKYLFEYVLDNRFIGLYSFKNNCIFEIDTSEKGIRKKEYYLSGEQIKRVGEIYRNKKIILGEKRVIDRVIYKGMMNTRIISDSDIEEKLFGEKVYRAI